MKKDKEQNPCLFLFIGRLNSIFLLSLHGVGFLFLAVLFLIKRGYNYNEVQAAVNSLNKKSVATIAKEVIAGKWGNGSDRKKKLESAGYNYNEVQKEVNRLL